MAPTLDALSLCDGHIFVLSTASWLSCDSKFQIPDPHIRANYSLTPDDSSSFTAAPVQPTPCCQPVACATQRFLNTNLSLAVADARLGKSQTTSSHKKRQISPRQTMSTPTGHADAHAIRHHQRLAWPLKSLN